MRPSTRTICLFFACCLATASTAFASGIDYFDAVIDASGNVTGGGTGYETAEGDVWLPYPDAPTGPWVNQWFYDDPTDPARYKEIWLQFLVSPDCIYNDMVLDFTINWTTLAWPDTGTDGAPPMANQETYINRAATHTLEMWYVPLDSAPGALNANGTWYWTSNHPCLVDPFGNPSEVDVSSASPSSLLVEWHYIIPDYNPEWISIDIRGENVVIAEGWIEHHCLVVPEPATVALMGLGLAGFALRKMRGLLR